MSYYSMYCNLSGVETKYLGITRSVPWLLLPCLCIARTSAAHYTDVRMSVGVSYHQPHDCLLNCLFRRKSKKTSKLRVTGLCEGNSPLTGEFPAQMASNAENVPIWWRHHAQHWLCWPNRFLSSIRNEFSYHQNLTLRNDGNADMFFSFCLK